VGVRAVSQEATNSVAYSTAVPVRRYPLAAITRSDNHGISIRRMLEISTDSLDRDATRGSEQNAPQIISPTVIAVAAQRNALLNPQAWYHARSAGQSSGSISWVPVRTSGSFFRFWKIPAASANRHFLSA
jgi:hypothetical protein